MATAAEPLRVSGDSSPARDRERSYLQCFCGSARRSGVQLGVPAGHGPGVTVTREQTSSCLVRDTQGSEGALFLSDVTDLVGKLLLLLPYYLLLFLTPKITLLSYHFLLKTAKPQLHRVLVGGGEKEEIISSCYFVEKGIFN